MSKRSDAAAAQDASAAHTPPVNERVSDRPPTAQRVLAAARRVLERDGFAGLTMEAVQAESGENKAAVWYYFGGKRGLILALADSIEVEDTQRLLEGLAEAGGLGEKLDVFMEVQKGLKNDNYMVFWELLPHMARDPEMRANFAHLMEWYRDVDRRALTPDGADPDGPLLQKLSMLTVAVADGLAVQLAADAEVDVDGALELWGRMLRALIAEAEAGGELTAG